MQSHLQINHNKAKRLGLIIVKLAVVGACSFFIYRRLYSADGGSLWSILSFPHLSLVLCLALLLTPLNWYLEALKWKCCLKPVILLENNEALNAVLRGLSLNWVLPFTIGDFVGRILGIEKSRKTVVAMLLNKYVSLLVTIVLGAVSALWFFELAFLTPVVLSVTMAGLLVVTPRLFRRYGLQDIIKLFLLTIIRYGVFTFQFVLIASFIVPEVSIITWVLGTPMVLAIKSVVPSVLGGIGLREAATIAVFGTYSDSVAALTLASLLVWLINIVIPSIYGLVPIITYKVKLQR